MGYKQWPLRGKSSEEDFQNLDIAVYEYTKLIILTLC